MSNILVSGVVNFETNVPIHSFPIPYTPVCYPTNQITSSLGGVAFNVSKALSTLTDNVTLLSMIGNDLESFVILNGLKQFNIKTDYIQQILNASPRSVILYDGFGKRRIHSDIKDLQQKSISFDSVDLTSFDVIVACNVNFNRPLLQKARNAKKVIAVDVHVLRNVFDEYNKDFLNAANILFLSDEGIAEGQHIDFIYQLKCNYPADIIVMGCGSKGALLYTRTGDKLYNFAVVPNHNIVNTIGAGDSLFSSFIHFYTKGDSAVEALKKAEIFASKKISSNGSSLGFLSEKEIEELFVTTNIQVTEL